jgi:hypothetical protein
LEKIGDVAPKNGFFESFWELEYYEVHLTSNQNFVGFYVLAYNDSAQFGNFFQGKEVTNDQILVGLQGSEGLKSDIPHGKKLRKTQKGL